VELRVYPKVFLELRMLKEGRGQKQFWSEAGYPGIFRRDYLTVMAGEG